jgi:hypothetical protein
MRDIFITADGRIMTLIPNSKAKKPALREKGIPRFPAPAVSQLLIDYLARPVLNLFCQYLNMPGAIVEDHEKTTCVERSRPSSEELKSKRKHSKI